MKHEKSINGGMIKYNIKEMQIKDDEELSSKKKNQKDDCDKRNKKAGC